MLVPHSFGWPNQALAFDVAVHVGTLFAVVAVTGYLCIAWLLRVIYRFGLGPFAIYRFLVAGVLFWIFA